jgi:hypothetical protein
VGRKGSCERVEYELSLSSSTSADGVDVVLERRAGGGGEEEEESPTL